MLLKRREQKYYKVYHEKLLGTGEGVSLEEPEETKHFLSNG
jgi:hypothetical protein